MIHEFINWVEAEAKLTWSEITFEDQVHLFKNQFIDDWNQEENDLNSAENSPKD